MIPNLRYLTHSPIPGQIGPWHQHQCVLHALFHGKITFLNLVEITLLTHDKSRDMIHFQTNGQLYQLPRLFIYTALAV